MYVLNVFFSCRIKLMERNQEIHIYRFENTCVCISVYVCACVYTMKELVSTNTNSSSGLSSVSTLLD